MQKALIPAHSLSGFSPQPRQNNVLTGVGRKRAAHATVLPDQAPAGTSVSCSRHRLGQETEVAAPRHRHPHGQAQVAISVSRSRQGLGRETEMTTPGHRSPPDQALSGFLSLPSKQGFDGRDKKRAAPKKTPEAVSPGPRQSKKIGATQTVAMCATHNVGCAHIHGRGAGQLEGCATHNVGCARWKASGLFVGVNAASVVPDQRRGSQQGWRRSRLDLSL